MLEIGGQAPSLRQALVAAGVTPLPPQLRQQSGPAIEDVRTNSDAGSQPQPDLVPVPRPSPEPPADFLVVKLARGQTLIHLAKQHLGDGNRFRDLLALNGWTEADARRLPENQLVKVPLMRSAERAGGR
ncbi:MAG: hypothetical protein ABIP94_01555 [Planctomycetota bacterium]